MFHVGKGNGNRAFSHLSERQRPAGNRGSESSGTSDELERIEEIRKAGTEPRIEILVHVLDDDRVARKIEGSIIDLLGIDNLTNIHGGYESRDFGRMTAEQVSALYGAERFEVTDLAILINFSASFRYGMRPIELYDATSSAWVVGPKRETAK